jgi:hypothetical protein
MENLYRVIPFVPSAKKGEPGHPLYFPPNQGLARVDNSNHYSVGYLATTGSCAISESFGFLSSWDSMMLRPIKTLPESRWVIATYILKTESVIFDMDDAANLLKLRIRPSRVVTRDRAITQSWALKVHKNRVNSGVSWWSFYNPDWSCVGLWDLSILKVKGTEELTLENSWLEEASRATNTPIIR